MINKIVLQCNNCRCKPVCKEVENWSKYCEEHIKLREKSILFDKEPNCPYCIGYISAERIYCDTELFINKISKSEDIKSNAHIIESPYIKTKLNDEKYKGSIRTLESLLKSICKAEELRR